MNNTVLVRQRLCKHCGTVPFEPSIQMTLLRFPYFWVNLDIIHGSESWAFRISRTPPDCVGDCDLVMMFMCANEFLLTLIFFPLACYYGPNSGLMVGRQARSRSELGERLSGALTAQCCASWTNMR